MTYAGRPSRGSREMPIEPEFKVGEAVCLVDSDLLKPEVRGVRGVVRDIQQGSTWRNPPRDANRWEYAVDFDMPLGSQRLIPEGILAPAPN